MKLRDALRQADGEQLRDRYQRLIHQAELSRIATEGIQDQFWSELVRPALLEAVEIFDQATWDPATHPERWKSLQAAALHSRRVLEIVENLAGRQEMLEKEAREIAVKLETAEKAGILQKRPDEV